MGLYENSRPQWADGFLHEYNYSRGYVFVN